LAPNNYLNIIKEIIISKTNTSPSPKNAGSSLQFQTALKIHESIRNSASNLYWWSVKDPWHDVFEAGGSTSKKSKLG